MDGISSPAGDHSLWAQGARLSLDCKTVGSFLKLLRKSVKRGVRVLHARSARASHARRACEAREKHRLSVFHTTSSF